MDFFLAVLGVLIGIAGLLIAWFQYNDKLRLERFSKATLQGMAGDIAKIHQSASWARANLRDAHNTAIQLAESELKQPLLTFISNGLGDASAADQLLVNLFNSVLNIQKGEFDTRIVTHPERNELYLYNKEQAQNKA